MEKIAHFCQSCCAANEPGEMKCRVCGTRLMIVTLPPSLRHEEEIIAPSYYEDHLLERVTLLEFRLSQVTEQLAMAYEFISKQSESFEKDHLVIQSFVDSVKEINPEIHDSLIDNFSKIYTDRKEETESNNRQKDLLRKIISNHTKPNLELFSHLVEEGMELLNKDEEKQAFRTLERATLLSSDNVHLLLFFAEKLFVAHKFDAAKKYLKQVFELAPQEAKAILLLGVIYADEGNGEIARKFLSVLAGLPNSMVCANYTWGMLAAFENNWKESIVAFKECLETSDSAEIYYLIGCGYFQLKDFDNALNYVEKGLSIDSKFADAWFMKSVIFANLNKVEQSIKSKFMAFDVKEAGARCLKFHKKEDIQSIETALPFMHFGIENKRVLTNSSLRLNKFFYKMIFESLN